jgi:hypothetical protein
MKILIYICIISSLLFSYNVSHWKCEINIEDTDSVAGMVDNCFKDSETLVIQADNLAAGRDTNELIKGYIRSLWWILWVIAILMIVYSGFLMTLSWGDDEKIKKWKDVFKWTIIWFIALVSAGGIISLLISTIFEFSRLA